MVLFRWLQRIEHTYQLTCTIPILPNRCSASPLEPKVILLDEDALHLTIFLSKPAIDVEQKSRCRDWVGTLA